MKYRKCITYILDGKKPVKETSHLKWQTWMYDNDRMVAFDKRDNPDSKGALDSEIFITTLFMGIDMSYGIGKIPLLFITIIWFGKLKGEIARSSTWDTAEETHNAAVRRVENSIGLGAIHDALHNLFKDKKKDDG